MLLYWSAFEERLLRGDVELSQISIVSGSGGKQIDYFLLLAQAVVKPNFGPETAMFKRPPSFCFGNVIAGKVTFKVLSMKALLKLLVDEFEGHYEHMSEVDMGRSCAGVNLQLASEEFPKKLIPQLAHGAAKFLEKLMWNVLAFHFSLNNCLDDVYVDVFFFFAGLAFPEREVTGPRLQLFLQKPSSDLFPGVF